MADRQTFQLTTRILALADVIASQDAAGAVEAGKATLQDLKELMQGAARIVVVNLNYNGGFSYQIRENDYGAPMATIVFTNPSNGIIQMDLPVAALSVTKTKFVLNALNGGGVPYSVIEAILSPTLVQFKLVPPGGVVTSTPFFDNYKITMINYK